MNTVRPPKKTNRRTTNLGPGMRSRVQPWGVTAQQQLRIRVPGAVADVVVQVDRTTKVFLPGTSKSHVTREPAGGKSLRLDVVMQDGAE